MSVNPEFQVNSSSAVGVSPELNDLVFCQQQLGADGNTPGRFENGTCCCPAVPQSGCGQFCGGPSKTNAAPYQLQDPWADVMNATLRWWAMNYTGYAIWHWYDRSHLLALLVCVFSSNVTSLGRRDTVPRNRPTELLTHFSNGTSIPPSHRVPTSAVIL